MRPRYQKGQIVKRSGMWVLRYYEDRIENGERRRVRVSKNIAPTSECRTESEARNKADNVLLRSGVNDSTQSPEVSLSVTDFIVNRYFPNLEHRLTLTGVLHLEPSTLKGYRDIWRFHVENSSIKAIRLREFKPQHAQAFFSALNPELSHQSHLRIRAFISGVFSYARQIGAYEGVHPIQRDTKVGGKKKQFEGHAYSLIEVGEMLKKLPEPARTVCAVAAFTGLSASEIRGLRWQDYSDGNINVSQKVWRTHVGAPKTQAREGAVPVIPVLQKMLKAYRQATPGNEADFIFRGDKLNFALSLDNLSRRVIAPILNGDWHGWHSFRRGIASRLFYANTDGKTVQTILRHANIATTLAHYVVPDAAEARAAMKKFNKAVHAATQKK